MSSGRHRKTWSKSEDALLTSLVARYGDARGPQSKWKTVAERFPGRTAKDCRKRWFHSLDPSLRKGRWTEEEDQVLLEAYIRLGSAWHIIASMIPGRKDDQCAKRYNEILNPSAKDRLCPWSPSEDKILGEGVRTLGNQWSTISKRLPGRPPLTCRNRWRALSKGAASPAATESSQPSADEGMANTPVPTDEITYMQASSTAHPAPDPDSGGLDHLDPSFLGIPMLGELGELASHTPMDEWWNEPSFLHEPPGHSSAVANLSSHTVVPASTHFSPRPAMAISDGAELLPVSQNRAAIGAGKALAADSISGFASGEPTHSRDLQAAATYSDPTALPPRESTSHEGYVSDGILSSAPLTPSSQDSCVEEYDTTSSVVAEASSQAGTQHSMAYHLQQLSPSLRQDAHHSGISYAAPRHHNQPRDGEERFNDDQNPNGDDTEAELHLQGGVRIVSSNDNHHIYHHHHHHHHYHHHHHHYYHHKEIRQP